MASGTADTTTMGFCDNPALFMLSPPHKEEFDGVYADYAKLSARQLEEGCVSKVCFVVQSIFLTIKMILMAPITFVKNVLTGVINLCSFSLTEALEDFKTAGMGTIAYIRAAIVLPFLMFVGLISTEKFQRAIPRLPASAPLTEAALRVQLETARRDVSLTAAHVRQRDEQIQTLQAQLLSLEGVRVRLASAEAATGSEDGDSGGALTTLRAALDEERALSARLTAELTEVRALGPELAQLRHRVAEADANLQARLEEQQADLQVEMRLLRERNTELQRVVEQMTAARRDGGAMDEAAGMQVVTQTIARLELLTAEYEQYRERTNAQLTAYRTGMGAIPEGEEVTVDDLRGHLAALTIENQGLQEAAFRSERAAEHAEALLADSDREAQARVRGELEPQLAEVTAARDELNARVATLEADVTEARANGISAEHRAILRIITTRASQEFRGDVARGEVELSRAYYEALVAMTSSD